MPEAFTFLKSWNYSTEMARKIRSPYTQKRKIPPTQTFRIRISAGFGTILFFVGGRFWGLEVPVLVVCGLLDFMTPAFTQYEIAGLAPKVKLIPIAAGRAGINGLVFLG